ncbi:MAG: DedA family protein [Ktedonobacteraceae bacterium]|nr:DedA family protein [Ktedonobacteraceae bacterium]
MLHTIIHVFFHTSPLLIYLIVAVFLLLESCGVPIVNNTLLLFTGALVSMGYLNPVPLLFAAIGGSIAGACLAYKIGERGGRRGLLRLAARVRLDEQKVRLAENWFQRSGAWMIFFSRVTPFVRPFACFLGGIAMMPFKRFFAAALSGSVLWCVLAVSVGMLLGRHWAWGLRLVQAYTIPACLALLLLASAYLLLRSALKRRLRARLSAEDGVGNDKHSRELLEV